VGSDYSNVVWKELKTLFDKANKIQVMRIETELISLDPFSFERIEDYLARLKELQLKLGESRKDFPKKDG
jgi:hypothetical protein